MAIAYMLMGDTTNSLVVFDRLLAEAANTSCDVVVNVVRIYNSQKKYNDVIRIMNICLSNCPVDNNTPYCYYLLGTANFELKNFDASIIALKKAIEINPLYFFAYIYLGDVYINQKNNAEGEKLFDYVIETAKTEPEKYANELGMAFGKIAGQKLNAKKYQELQKVAKQ
jgi:tetratricopeptide (TPR) repeat protein